MKLSIKKIFVILSLIFGLVAWLLYGWIFDQGPLFASAHVIINKGNTSNVVASKLKDAGVINKKWLFKISAKFMGLDKKLKAGEYLFEPNVSMFQTLKKLANGDVIYRKITIPEGLTISQIFNIINKEKSLSGEITLDLKDGDILPETYSFMYDDTRDSILLQAKKAMDKALDDAWNNRDEKLPIKDKKQLLTLASIIEKETSIDSERKLVASVFVNRLFKGMKLQTDPTVIYAITLGKKDLGRSLKKKDLKIDSPYNTYKYYGLPPAPICNPGRASLDAAANPDVSPYLYFVANGNGGHNFSTSLKDHNVNVKSWIKETKSKKKQQK